MFASVYILASGLVARSLTESVEELERLERFKGIGFVGLTALGLFVVARMAFRRELADAEEAARARDSLLRSERTALAGLFVSSIAHDAANISMVVSSALEDLQGESGLRPESRDSLERASAAVRTLNKLFRDLRGMGRARDASKRVEVELNATVADTVGLLRGHSALKHCQVSVCAPEGVRLLVFPVLVEQVLINLLLNAADATSGRGRLEVRLSSNPEGVSLEVHDDGPGVPQDMVAGLFKPVASTKPHGTGLGLVSVRECALAHGGTAEYAQSAFGGACFRVRFPRNARMTPAAGVPTRTPEAT